MVATIQIVAINAYFVCDAIGFIPWVNVPFKAPGSIFQVFTVSVFVEVVALAFVVTRSLFPGGGGFWESILGIFKKNTVP